MFPGDWKEVILRIARAVREVLDEDARIYVFGSAVKDEMAAVSDLDVAVVVEDEVDPGKMASDILERAGVDPFIPVHLHVVTRDEFGRNRPRRARRGETGRYPPQAR
ncbi:nucleotidyltransferase domain-containing protein [Methanopyrus kandleri]